MTNIKLSVFLVFFIISRSTYAQSLTTTVLPSFGGSAAVGDVQLNWTLGETFTPTLAAGKTILTQGFQQPELQIWTGNVNTAICPGSTVTVPYIASGITSTNNKFIAELSDAKGWFNYPMLLDSIRDNKNGTFTVSIPTTISTGGNYRIRVKSSISAFTGTDNGQSITISRVIAEIPDAYATTYNSGIAVNTIYNGWVASLMLSARVIEGVGPFSYVWKNSRGVTVGTANTYKVTAADAYTLTVIDHKGCTSTSTKAIVMKDVRQATEGNLNVLVYPNPSPTTFTLQVQSDVAELVSLAVVNELGQIIESRSNIVPGQKFTLGSRYVAGIYFAKFIQGSKKKAVKLLKL